MSASLGSVFGVAALFGLLWLGYGTGHKRGEFMFILRATTFHKSLSHSSVMATPQIITCQSTVDIPAVDIASFVFSSGTPESRQNPQYFDADSPSRCYSLSEAELYVKRISKGLINHGLQPDDKVMLFSGNALYFPVLFWGVVAARCVFTSVNPGASETGKIFCWPSQSFHSLISLCRA